MEERMATQAETLHRETSVFPGGEYERADLLKFIAAYVNTIGFVGGNKGALVEGEPYEPEMRMAAGWIAADISGLLYALADSDAPMISIRASEEDAPDAELALAWLGLAELFIEGGSATIHNRGLAIAPTVRMLRARREQMDRESSERFAARRSA